MLNYLGYLDNYIEVNVLVMLVYIVFEWYFLLFYVILCVFIVDVWVVQLVEFIIFGIVDVKFFGVLVMFGVIVVMVLVFWLDIFKVCLGCYCLMFKWWFVLLVVDFIVLMWVGV